MKSITSVHNPRIKAAARLRSARHRAKDRRVIIDGARELLRAATGGARLVELFVCEPLCKSPESLEVLARLRESADSWHVPPVVFERIAFGERNDGVLGIAETPLRTLENFQPTGDGPIVVLEGLEKPGNVGAILRTADAAGVAGVIVAGGRTDLFNPNCIRASLGTVFTQPVCEATTVDALGWLRRHQRRMFAARPDAPRWYTEVNLSGHAAIILGSEAHGLSSVWQHAEVTGIKLPMLGIADSLNVSAASAVLFYEALRQRSASKS